MIIFCDIDGVLADPTHRLPYLKNKGYDKFYDAKEMFADPLIPLGRELVNRLSQLNGHTIKIFVTGRPERTRIVTRMWLDKHHVEVDDVDLFMRSDGDYRPSPEIKKEIILRYMEMAHTFHHKLIPNSLFIDDDPENVIAVERAIPEMTGLIFSTKRMRGLKKEKE